MADGESTRLYRQCLGTAWDRLAASVRRLHDTDPRASMEARGVFRVEHGGNWGAHLLVRLFRMPAAAEEVPVRLRVERRGERELWTRRFGDHRLTSRQWRSSTGLLVERLGILECRFQLWSEEGALGYRQCAFGLACGPLRLPLPSFLSARITASETPAGDDDRMIVIVEVSAPLVGLMLKYGGELRIEGSAPNE